LSFKDKIIISSESRPKAVFDMFVLFLVGYSCVTSVYSVAFQIDDSNTNNFAKTFDLIVEGFFWLDLCLNFIQSFKNQETYENVTDLKEIAKQYVLKGWFFIDFVSVFPFEYIFTGLGKQTKLFRLARLPRLLKLIDISRFNKMVKSLMSNSSRDERIVAQYMMLYIFKIFRLIIIAMIITYFIGCIWFYFSDNVRSKIESEGCETEPCDSDSHSSQSFIKYFDMDKMESSEKLVISCYFALTTLSTVGYGDYHPVSNIERILAVLIMLGGVAFFSYIMGNFIEIISNYEKKMGVVDKSGDLHNWLILLTRFTNNQPLPKSLTA
jgi:hypothetical protein